MTVVPLYALAGEPVAFRRDDLDRYVFGLDGSWIGWLPFADSADVHSPTSGYVGSIEDDRLVVLPARPYRRYPGFPGAPDPLPPPLPATAPTGPVSATDADDVPRWLLSRTQHLFAASGQWVATRIGAFVHAPDGTWVGWCGFERDLVLRFDGTNLGQITVEDRLLHRDDLDHRARPSRPRTPAPPPAPDPSPPQREAVPLPEGWSDVEPLGRPVPDGRQGPPEEPVSPDEWDW